MKRYIKPWEDWHSIYEGAKGLKSRKIVLLDGTSSAGKSHALKHLGVRPYWKAKGTGGWVVVASDDFSGTGKGEGREGEERRLKLDHPNIRPWAKENEDAGIVYPNPTEGKVWVRGVAPGALYRIVDVLGREMGRGLAEQDGAIPVEFLSSGTYFIVLEQGVFQFVRK